MREGSYNTAALRALKEIASDLFDIDVITLHDVELFNEDVEARGWPKHVRALRDRVKHAEGVVFATPEYNYSVTGVLKNAIDWLSRPPGKGPLRGKPATIIGASPSMIGTARAQADLRQILFYNAMPLLPTAEVLIGRAVERFDGKGELTHEETRLFLRDMAEKFAGWTRAHRH